MSPAPAQYLLTTERQMTLDGRAEPLLDTRPAAPVVEFLGGALVDTRTGELLLDTPRQRRLDDYTPKSVYACQGGWWNLKLTRKATGERSRVAFRCRSWRCRRCRRDVAKVDYARISTALRSVPPDELVYMVLTLDQRRDFARGMTKQDAYASLLRRWQSFVQWMRRHCGRVRYVMTVEQHRSGWPHANVILHAPTLRRQIEWTDSLDEPLGRKPREAGLAPDWLRDAAESCGLGRRLWTEQPRSVEAMAGYVVKLAHQETLTGEVAKLSQVPLKAPRGFRRLRASPGFLPKRLSRGEYAGELDRRPLAQAEAMDAFLEAFAPMPAATEPPGGPQGGEATAQPPTEASGGGGAGTVERPAALVSTRTSHSRRTAKQGLLVLQEGFLEPLSDLTGGVLEPPPEKSPPQGGPSPRCPVLRVVHA